MLSIILACQMYCRDRLSNWLVYIPLLCMYHFLESKSESKSLLWMEDQSEDQSDHFLWLSVSLSLSHLSIDTEKDSHYPASNSVSSFAKSEEIRPWLELLITLHPRIYIERVSPSSVRLRISKYIPLESRPRSVVLCTSEDSRDSIRTCS